MPAPITTLRASLAAALANSALYSTYDFPPPTITANSCIVAPADGDYLTPSNNTNLNISPLANLKVILTVPLLDNKGNLNGIETMACAVFKKLAQSTIVMNVGSMSAPSVLSVQSGDLLTASFNISVLTSWEQKMSYTDEDIAFLIKIGQITETGKKETKTAAPIEKTEE